MKMFSIFLFFILLYYIFFNNIIYIYIVILINNMSDAKAAAAARRAKILSRDKNRLDIAKGLKVYININLTFQNIIIILFNNVFFTIGCIRG